MRKRKLHLNDLEVENYSYMNVTDILYIIYLALSFTKKSEDINLHNYLI